MIAMILTALTGYVLTRLYPILKESLGMGDFEMWAVIVIGLAIELAVLSNAFDSPRKGRGGLYR